MEKFLVVMVMLASCHAETQDLSGKVFVFPKETNTDHVKLITSKTSFNALTVCLRFFTDLTRNYGLFSLATSRFSNDFVLFKTNTGDVISMYARDGGTEFLSLSFPPNSWHSMCSTWESENGIAQLWVDGRPTVKRFIHSGQPISGETITILGQEQDNYGGGFDATQSFVGMISRVHAWDYVLSPPEIHHYMKNLFVTPGNVFNWKALEFKITGNILVDEEVM
ncbi:C-reactive protein-like [Stigmatopora argus]